MKFRAAIYKHEGSEVVLTGPEHAGLSDEALVEQALTEARSAGLIGDEYPRVSEKVFKSRLYIGAWEE